MEAGEGGRTRGAYFVAVFVEVVAIAGLMWAVFSVGRDFPCFFFVFFFSLNEHGLLQV